MLTTLRIFIFRWQLVKATACAPGLTLFDAHVTKGADAIEWTQEAAATAASNGHLSWLASNALIPPGTHGYGDGDGDRYGDL